MLFNVQSSYTFLESTINIKEYVMQAKALGYRYVGIADYDVLHGAYELYQCAHQHDLKPLIGLRLNLSSFINPTENNEVIFYALNHQGFRELIQLSQLASGNRLPTDIWSFIQQNMSNIVYLMPNRRNEFVHAIIQNDDVVVDRIVNLLRQTFDDRVYLSIQLIPYNEYEVKEILRVAKQYNLPVVINQFVHAMEETDGLSLELMKAIKDNQQINFDELAHRTNYYLYPAKYLEQIATQHGLVDLIDHTNNLVDRLQVEIIKNPRVLPKFKIPEDFSASADYLSHIVYQRLNELGLSQVQAYTDRIEHELSIINNMGFNDYFLIVWNILDYCYQNNIPVGPGRGSAAGSLTAYLLNITQVDPIHYDLIFERFLNPDRLTMPDIDIDVSDEQRHKVLRFIQQHYGEDHTAQIITFNTFGARSTIRDILRITGATKQVLQRWSQAIPTDGNQSMTLERAYNESSDLRDIVNESKINRAIFDAALKIEGLPRQSSTHAAAIVISEEPINYYIPVKERENDLFITQFPMDEVESLGLLKIDILGLKNISIRDHIVDSINKSRSEPLDIHNIPLDDNETLKIFQKGFTNGVFQFESPGIKRVLRQLHPESFEDIVAVNALYRPGPMEQIGNFIARKHGKQPIKYAHPIIEPILESTYGIIVYQEQIMQIAVQLASFTMGEADSFRRAIAKKDAKTFNQYRDKFVQGAVNNGVEKATANEIFNYIEAFANYGFNRSHAVVYSLTAYQLAYFKAHYPEHFYANVLNAGTSQNNTITQYFNEAINRLDKILPVDINRSQGLFSVDTHLRIGFNAVKGLRRDLINIILDERANVGPFSSFTNFTERIPEKYLNEDVIKPLVLTGAFDRLELNRQTIIQNLSSFLQYSVGNFSLFAELSPKINYYPEFSLQELRSFEFEYLGFSLQGNPLTSYKEYIHSNPQLLSIEELIDHRQSGNVSTIGFIKSLKTHITKNNQPMAFVTLSDGINQMDLVIFPNVYTKYLSYLKEDEVIQIRGKLEERKGQKQILVNSILQPQIQSKDRHNARCFIRIQNIYDAEQAVVFLQELVRHNSGPIPIILSDYEKNIRQLDASFNIHSGNSVQALLYDFFGRENVVFTNI